MNQDANKQQLGKVKVVRGLLELCQCKEKQPPKKFIDRGGVEAVTLLDKSCTFRDHTVEDQDKNKIKIKLEHRRKITKYNIYKSVMFEKTELEPILLLPYEFDSV